MNTLTCDLRVGIFDCNHHTGQAGSDQRITTGWRASVVRTRLQRDPRCDTAQIPPSGLRCTQGHDLCVRTTSLLGRTDAENLTVGSSQNTANAGVRVTDPNRSLGGCQGQIEPGGVECVQRQDRSNESVQLLALCCQVGLLG